MFSRFAKQMTSQFIDLGKSRKITSNGRTGHRIIRALIFTDSESSGFESNPSEEQNTERLNASTSLVDTWTPGPSQAVNQDCGREPVPGQRSTPPTGDIDVDNDGRKRPMLQQMEALQIALQLKILLEKQEAEQKLKLDEKKLDSELEEQRIQDLTAALSQNRAFEELEKAHQTTLADSTAGGKNQYMLLKALPLVVLGAGAAAYAVPVALKAVGFTSSGIAAKSLAAYLMKLSALHCRGGVPACGAVAILQSLGAKACVSYLNGIIGGSSVLSKLLDDKKDDDKLKED
ncbi:uncharacterized protein LOC144823778 [Lissotriton helveticus]